jgi:hypothetical protein
LYFQRYPPACEYLPFNTLIILLWGIPVRLPAFFILSNSNITEFVPFSIHKYTECDVLICQKTICRFSISLLFINFCYSISYIYYNYIYEV